MFPFFFVVKSLYRKQIDELTKDSRIQKWVFATPEVEIDDPTGEIRRLKKQVNKTSLSVNSSPVEDGEERKTVILLPDSTKSLTKISVF